MKERIRDFIEEFPDVEQEIDNGNVVFSGAPLQSYNTISNAIKQTIEVPDDKEIIMAGDDSSFQGTAVIGSTTNPGSKMPPISTPFVLQSHIGIELYGGKFKHSIPYEPEKIKIYPFESEEYTLYTVFDNQRSVTFPMYEGFSEVAKNNAYIATSVLHLNHDYPESHPLKYKIKHPGNYNDPIHVHAYDPDDPNNVLDEEVVRTQIRTAEEFAEMRKISIEQQRADEITFKNIAARNSLETILLRLKSNIENNICSVQDREGVLDEINREINLLYRSGILSESEYKQKEESLLSSYQRILVA